MSTKKAEDSDLVENETCVPPINDEGPNSVSTPHDNNAIENETKTPNEPTEELVNDSSSNEESDSDSSEDSSDDTSSESSESVDDALSKQKTIERSWVRFERGFRTGW